jgi:hypothetical protein
VISDLLKGQEGELVDLPEVWLRGQKTIVFFWIKSLAHINLFTSLPFGGLSPDPLSSIADSPELPGQQSPHRSNISIPKTVLGTVKFVIGHGTPAAKTFHKKQFIH